jgi:hypothetical protein
MDVHQATISVAVMDSAGKLILESILETKDSTILQFIGGLRGSLLVTFEVGFYYIVIHFSSGDSTRLDYDGENPNIPDSWDVNTTHRFDSIVSVECKNVR